MTTATNYTMLVHYRINGTDKSPLVGIEESHGVIWAMDEEHLTKLIKFATGKTPVFGERKLTNIEPRPQVVSYMQTLARKMGKLS